MHEINVQIKKNIINEQKKITVNGLKETILKKEQIKKKGFVFKICF